MVRKHIYRHRIRKFWADSVRFHGKPCSVLALGVRVCDTALRKLNLSAPEPERLVCVSEYVGCCTDAVQICLHCTAGKKHLLYYKTGRLIFTIYDLHSENSVRICVRPEVVESLRQLQPEEVLTMPEEALFYFEEAHPLTERTRKRVCRACDAPAEGVPYRDSGVQDSPDQFRKFDLSENDACRVTRRRK
ncbi:MAG: formylmethanofuran dehydrogenase subunit E family protein [Eubacteriales bacterium]|nr:formylmethanofuran dehydrogenase subunit E family protein [Eubacteriales bacterium]